MNKKLKKHFVDGKYFEENKSTLSVRKLSRDFWYYFLFSGCIKIKLKVVNDNLSKN